MSDAQVVFVGNATKDPELRFTPAGKSVASFGLAINKRVKDGDDWVDGDPTFVNVSAWDGLADNVAESVVKGMRVIVTGRLEVRQYDKDDGTKGTSVDVTADEVGPSLKWATATVSRNEKQ